MKLLSAQQMQDMDRCAIGEYGMPGIVLMENAGRGAAAIIADRYSALRPGPVLIVVGKGNNGGDGFVIARHLTNRGWNVRLLVLAQREQIGGDAAANLCILEHNGDDIAYAPDSASFKHLWPGYNNSVLVVDAIFGNGLNSEIRGHYRDAVLAINALGVPVAAVDMPSGIDATSGAVLGAAVQADCSISFACAKVGQVSYPACDFGGELFVVDIGMPARLQAQVGERYMLVDEEQARVLLPPRPASGHKGTFGHTLVVAGSSGKSGAARLCATAALRSGCGLVTLALPQSQQQVAAVGTAEVMTIACVDENGAFGADCVNQIEQAWRDKNVLALGPGLGQEIGARRLVEFVVAACPVPLVLDADALNCISANATILAGRASGTVITPHPGEMARITGLTTEEIQRNRVAVAAQWAEKLNSVVLLKGARTVIAAPDGRVWINSSGASGMASAGMGDVLTGVIAALVAQGMEPFAAAALGAYLHGRAAELCAQEFGSVGYLAGDVMERLGQARQQLIDGGI